MDVAIGALASIAIGVLAIAAIVQLSKNGAPLASDATKLGTTTLTSIFK